MSRKSRARQLDNPVEVQPQRFTWKTIATYDRYEDAKQHVDDKPLWETKIKRRGDRFEVRKGTPIKKAAVVTPVEEPVTKEQ